MVLAGSASRLGVELARAAGGHLVGNGLDVVVGGVGGGHIEVWCFGDFDVCCDFFGLIGEEDLVNKRCLDNKLL